VPHETHAATHSLAQLLLVDRTLPSFLTHGSLDGCAGDTDFLGNEHQLVKRESAIGRIVDKMVQARGEVDDFSHFIAWESPLLLLRIHKRKSTVPRRSLFRQIDVDHVEFDQVDGAIPGAKVC